MTAGPVLRQDLLASMSEENGAGWVEVSDPASGKMLRLAEDDFVVLCGLDGSDLSDLAARARERLGLKTTVDEITSLSTKVAALGFLEVAPAVAPSVAAPPAVAPVAAQPRAPAPAPAAAKPAPAPVVVPPLMVPPVVAPPPAAPPPAAAPRVTPPAAAPMLIPPAAQPSSGRRPPPDLRGAVPKVDAPAAADLEVDVEAPLPTPVTRQPVPYQPPVPAAPAARPPAATMLGVGVPAMPKTAPAPAAAPTPAVVPHAPSFDLPIAEDLPPIQAPRAPAPAPAPVAARPQPAPVPVAPKPLSSPKAPAAAAKPAAPSSPPGAAGKPAAPRPTASPASRSIPAPIAAVPAPAPKVVEKKETRWTLVAILVAVGLLGGGAAYWFLWRAPATGPVEATGITIVKAQVAEVDSVLPGEGTLADVPPTVLSFQASGKIAELVPPGQKVKAGDQIAALDEFSKLGAALDEVRGRLNHYQNELIRAERTSDDERLEVAKSKIEEKKKMIVAFEKKRGESVLLAQISGTVENVAKVGAMVKAGQPVAKLVSGGVHAELTAAQPAAVVRQAGVEEGKEIRLVGGPAPYRAKVEKVEEVEGTTRIIAGLIDPPESARPGIKVHASKSGAVMGARIPATAVFERGGTSAVMTVRNGIAKGKPVKVLDRMGMEVVVDGLGDGEKFVVFGGAALRDGTRVSEAQKR